MIPLIDEGYSLMIFKSITYLTDLSETAILGNSFQYYNTVILSNFRKTRTKDRIVSYRIFFKNLEKKKQRIKLSNLFQTEIKNKNFEIKTDFFKQILQSTIF